MAAIRGRDSARHAADSSGIATPRLVQLVNAAVAEKLTLRDRHIPFRVYTAATQAARPLAIIGVADRGPHRVTRPGSPNTPSGRRAGLRPRLLSQDGSAAPPYALAQCHRQGTGRRHSRFHHADHVNGAYLLLGTRPRKLVRCCPTSRHCSRRDTPTRRCRGVLLPSVRVVCPIRRGQGFTSSVMRLALARAVAREAPWLDGHLAKASRFRPARPMSTRDDLVA